MKLVLQYPGGKREAVKRYVERLARSGEVDQAIRHACWSSHWWTVIEVVWKLIETKETQRWRKEGFKKRIVIQRQPKYPRRRQLPLPSQQGLFRQSSSQKVKLLLKRRADTE